MNVQIIETPELDKILKPDWSVNVNYTLLQKKEINTLINNNVWVTARGLKIRVNDMTTSHIKATMKCWLGLGRATIPDGYLGGKEKWLEILKKELLRRQ